ncbi:hypothetical protein RBG61_06615 [Paludicola sp. MB14-C6]|uniref:hypothetical protein n=1 Tax=Paludihabitans sp. MB14-C6 TaxID=3070656 RepID=UPI0027DADA3B|nr:hypothetical protein [Paludicola sp. MB14-C6]WMJ24334.1 hypothetical protein RBG61_06615 [Paludicola sp. MB14-C6]
MKVNYRIEAIKELLNRDCVLERYYPLILIKDKLIDLCISKNCFTKEECMKLPDEVMLQSGLINLTEINLFRCFLSMYDINNLKLKEIDGLTLTDEEIIAFKELYLLPGVKSTRAFLYCKSGFKSLSDIANSTSQEIIEKITHAVNKYSLNCKVPLVKEVKTHIAVSRAFTIYRVD